MNVQHCFENAKHALSKCASLWFLAYDIISNDCHGNDDDDGEEEDEDDGDAGGESVSPQRLCEFCHTTIPLPSLMI